MPNYYPIMLDVRNRLALVIGGNTVAAEKAAALSASGAQVTLLWPTFCEEIQALARTTTLNLLQKAYEYGDMQGFFVVVSATTYEPELTERIWQEGQERGQLVNIVDVPSRCNFIVPSILRRGQLTISVSTEGSSPALAKRIRQQLEHTFPLAYDQYLRIAALAREYLRQHGVSYDDRDAYFSKFFTSNILDLLTKNDMVGACATAVQLLHLHNIEISGSTFIQAIQQLEAQRESNP
ncbi:MAG TPA: bifunctional precorrin-2 dehydrogenase/sirohydrochlorin ferrochelatase [Dictyobacter sp.]|jgi:precorrin-2 dehydrogenase/sirohydrochlorin ferrochelatase|nr:bifunctional precorrin-2 dehydrogenase/sirohydrochlorin ferrochelatase [Dictyobacter sp.]